MLSALLVVPADAAARTHSARVPTQAQMRSAVQRAKRSHGLWATVNVCNTAHNPGVVGIRAEMPALGFASTLQMRFVVDYLSSTQKAYRPVAGATRSVTLGRQRTGLHQSGVSFSFRPHSGSLRGTVTFAWRLGSKLIGQVSLSTTRGHPHADFGDPAHYSSASCLIR